MRLFVAVNFNTETCSRLDSLGRELRLRSRQGNFSVPENLHLTLAFLGECTTAQVASAQAALDGISYEPFPICIEGIGRFRRDGGDIWWAGVQHNNNLLTVQRELTDKLVAAGFMLERRKYSPHITLGRRVVTDVLPWTIEPFGEMVNKVDLMRSERIGGKLIYTVIYEKAAGYPCT